MKNLRQLNKMVIQKKFIIEKYFDGPPKETDLKMVEETLPPLQNGGGSCNCTGQCNNNESVTEDFHLKSFTVICYIQGGYFLIAHHWDLVNQFLAEAVYLSVDPYMRAYAYKLPLGATMVGSQVAKIIDSKNQDFPVGKYIVGKFNWQTHTIHTGEQGAIEPTGHPPYILPDLGELPLSLALGVLGMPGLTAYFGLLEICKPKAGETVVITGAAGAVGSIVGQIAKIKGCKVVGITGSDAKSQYLIETLGFDACANYKSPNFEEQLAKAAPNGIDCYFDNVAGEISTIVMKYMNMYGRISVCGSISSYNTSVDTPPKVSCVQLYMLNKQLKMEGFQQYLFQDRKFEAMSHNQQWIEEKKLKYVETVTEGFENMTKAFIEMLEGKNIGKALVKV